MPPPLTLLLAHLHRHAIAVTAFVCSLLALAGASYAAFELPNHSIDPVKLNPRNIGGYVRAWASVNANGRVIASGGGVRVLRDFNVNPGHYMIDWHPRPASPCTAIGSVDEGTAGLVPGYLITESANTRARGEGSIVQTYDAQGQPTGLAFDVELLCSTPR